MSQKIFDTVKYTNPGRSTFDLSHDVKASMKFGNLYPIMCEDVAPGDKFRIGCESLVRFAPMIAPVMHRVDCTMHYFFVPKRILWDNFMKWYKGEKDPLTNLPYEHPWIKIYWSTFPGLDTNWNILHDHMGIPDPLSNGGRPLSGEVKINPFPFAAYQMIFNDYYRDQNLEPEVDFKLVDGDNDSNSDLQVMRRRAWMHDYFTSALPFAQKGDPVTIPIDGLVSLNSDAEPNPGIWRNASDQTTTLTGDVLASDGVATPIVGAVDVNNLSHIQGVYDPNDTLIVNNAAATLNDLRIAMRVQEWLEKSARGGTRDNEFIRVQFGVQTSDARLQRPEYITGIKTPVTISEVLNTTGTNDAPQGQMAGHGVSVINGNYGSYYAEEPGYIIGIMNVQPQSAYYQGIPKHFLKITEPTEHLFPVFGNLGEQAILNQEVYAYMANPNETFGYTPRYSEYKYTNNRVAGDFRKSLDFWHMARTFSSQPLLNEDFIKCNPTTRIFAVEDGTDYLWCHVYNKVSASRLLPFYGTPTF